MSDFVAVFNEQGLAALLGRLDRLRRDLEAIAKGRPEEGLDADFAMRLAAAGQLIAVLSFLDDSETLAPAVHQLLNALLTVDRGKAVQWLRPAKKRGKPPPSWDSVSEHASYAWFMNLLMERAGKSEEEAARFVVEHAQLRRRLKGSRADDWRVVANWRDRIKGGGATEEERIAYDATAELVTHPLNDQRDVEREAEKLLRDIKIHFSRGLNHP